MKVILISGKAENGKTETAKIIKSYLESHGKRVLIIPFADYLKFTCEKYFGWNGKKDEEGRKCLQDTGKKARDRDLDFWVRIVVNFIKVFSDDFDYFLVDDCRYENESGCFKGLDYLTVRVERLNFENSLTPEQREHISETELDNAKFDRYIRSESGIDNLRDQLMLNILKHPLWSNWFELDNEWDIVSKEIYQKYR
jgi:hypothetical protein